MSNKYPCVSVVMPMYNPNITYLKECLDSIFNQTFNDFELIVVDDGSTDLSGIELVRRYDDHRIRLICNKHDFIESLNIGVREANGLYIARMDADDIMLSERLKVQFDYLESHHDIDICGSWIECIGFNNWTCKAKIDHADIIMDLITNNALFHPTIMMRASSIVHRKNNLYESEFAYAEDYRLWTQLVMDGLIFSNISGILLKYRLHMDQVTNKYNTKVNQITLKAQLNYIQYVIEKIRANNSSYELLLDQLVDCFNQDLLCINDLSCIIQVLSRSYNK